MRPWKLAAGKFSTEKPDHGDRRFSTDASRSESRRLHDSAATESRGELRLIVEIGPPPATDQSAKWGMLADKVLGPPEESPQPDIDFQRWVRSA